ncbi:Asp-tRNA(Asn)/Glu-tRNA(Gln) amidotransferase subunit GatC [Verrucomicrobiota bacterium]
MMNKDEKTKKINVEYVAKLARISLSDDEKALFQKQLEEIVGYVNDIARVDVNGVQPATHSLSMNNVFRADKSMPGLDRDAVLKNAPLHDGQQFLVPKIV